MVVLNLKGEIIDEIKIPEKKPIIDIAVNDKEDLYAANYIDSKLYIYNVGTKKNKTVTGFAGSHLVDVFKDRYYVLDFNPKKGSELRLQTYTIDGELEDTKTQADLDLNLYTIRYYENNTISFDIIKGQKSQNAVTYTQTPDTFYCGDPTYSTNPDEYGYPITAPWIRSEWNSPPIPF